ncbi:MAG TPA: 2-oxoglutarate dehydrogenase E1 component, partial [Bryobacteraceae bacterium]|nr:2-oxoglutarate dehydrogenase E1 component [Bryobacteraceae bacterium]
YRELGHFVANLDPLGHNRPHLPLLDLGEFHISEADLDRQVGPSGFYGKTDGTLRDLIDKLRATYCRTIGVEYMYVSDKNQREWLAQRMEPICNTPQLTEEERRDIMYQLVAAQGFEEYLASKYVGAKRFGLEGAESFIPMLNAVIEHGCSLGLDQLVLGMAHRGRLNTLAHVLNKPYEMILTEFEGVLPSEDEGDGDVKYHLGYSHDRVTRCGRKVHVGLSFNPSHLELVNPVVEGIVRSKQYHFGDLLRTRVVPVLIHGDAAFTGQGIVLETLGLSEMPYWRTGGTIHIIINNQIGFTTMPKQGRFTPYPTDVAKTIQAPIFHVNGDDPEAAVRAVEIAFDYRQRFNKDVVIDMFCYRRHGHNEADDPSYTQPILYRKIKDHPSVATLYSERLVREQVLPSEEVDRLTRSAIEKLTAAFQISQERAERFEPRELVTISSDVLAPYCPHTAVDPATLALVAEKLTRFPPGFHLHPKLRGFVDRRRESFHSGGPIDWAFGEALAFGSLVLEGTPVRLSGQDSSRGTFSQRHLEFSDFETSASYLPLRHLSDTQARFDVFDSSLSEYAVLGFEFGYSVADPLRLVIWEAQFGDFVNGAQIMIDQFLSCAESKWGQPSGLVLLLPHGLEGQGPEHSSARIERFLTLCAGGNMQLVNATTPAQYFHVLRRQMCGGPDRRGMRKPLIIFTPKSLLRHAQAVSRVSDFSSGGFREVLPDGVAEPPRVTKLLFCSGKVFYELAVAREERRADQVAIVRLEQLYPFPEQDVQDVFTKYPQASEVVWVQEEPKNMGSWRFMREQIQPLLAASGRVLGYAGRPESASPATGSHKRHLIEQAAVIDAAFTLRPSPRAAR